MGPTNRSNMLDISNTLKGVNKVEAFCSLSAVIYEQFYPTTQFELRYHGVLYAKKIVVSHTERYIEKRKDSSRYVRIGNVGKDEK